MKAFTPLVLIAAVAAGGLLATPVTAAPEQSQSSSTTSPSTADSAFVRKAAQGNAKEIALGRLATTRGQSQAVKQYGQKIVHDHSANNQKLQTIASNAHLQWPAPSTDQSMATRKLTGTQAGFDRAFAQRMVKDHQKTIALFQKEVQNGRDPAITAYARSTLPTLQEHLRGARALTGQNSSMPSADGAAGAGSSSRQNGGMPSEDVPTGGMPASAGSH